MFATTKGLVVLFRETHIDAEAIVVCDITCDVEMVFQSIKTFWYLTVSEVFTSAMHIW